MSAEVWKHLKEIIEVNRAAVHDLGSVYLLIDS